MKRVSRRRTLALAATGIAAVAGCLGGDDSPYDGGSDNPAGDDGDGTVTSNADDNPTEPDDSAANETAIPLADEQLPVEYSFETLRNEIMSGGVPQDGIPSIDDPVFESVDDVGDRLDDEDPIFGVLLNGEAKAYPQNVLVYHEIVNDEIGGDEVSVTYCPLTGTAMGIDNGGVEFGVSGQLLNSNLVMYDREGETLWPQMLSTAIDGPLEGASLTEFPVYWSTWGRWREHFPDSLVLTEDTGYGRNYDEDPYGTYNPTSGYYEEESDTMFPPLSTDTSHPAKRMFLGARPQDGPLAIDREALAQEGVLTLEQESSVYVAVHDQRIGAGHLYRSDDDVSFTQAEDGTITDEDDGSTYEPDDLPLESVYAYEAMWFSWAGYYPSTAVTD